MFQLAKKGSTWFSIELSEAIRKLNEPRDRIVRALDYLGEKGWLKLEVSGSRHRYRRLRMPPDLAKLAESFHGRSVARERQEIARLGQVIEFVEQPGCQVASLCRHFGESRDEACGHCTRCLGHEQVMMSRDRNVPPLDENVLAKAMVVRRANLAVLADPVVMARWLLGITSPSLTRSKLSSNELFGALAQQPSGSLLERLKKEVQAK